MKHRRILIISLVSLIGMVIAIFLTRERAASISGELPQETLATSGVIQAQRVTIASELGGLIASIPVTQGAYVTEGTTLLQLDTTSLDGEIAVAEAMVEMAEASLAQAQAGARLGQIAVAEAQHALAQTALLAVRQSISDTQNLIDHPQDIDLQIAVMRAQLAAAEERAAQATAVKDGLEIAKDKYEEAYAQFDGGGLQKFGIAEGSLLDLMTTALPDGVLDSLPDDFGENLPSTGEHTFTFQDYELHIHDGAYQLSVWKDISFPLNATLLPNQWWQAWVGVNASTAQVDGLQAQLNQLYRQHANPQQLNTQLSELIALEAQLNAQLRAADVQVTALKAGLTLEEIAAIEAKVNQARAGYRALVAKRKMYSLTAPMDGTVVDILQQPGEIAAQGAPLLTLADLEDLTVTVYVPESRLGDIWRDQEVRIAVDSFPEETFRGTVAYIADEAEFTPRNVATVEERQTLVFAVDIHLRQVNGKLKPGMPADVTFITQTPAQP